MIKSLFLPGMFAIAASPLAAQIAPDPSLEEPRLQTVVYRQGQPIRLVAFPNANLTVVLERGERIQRAELSARDTFTVSVVGDGGSMNIRALRQGVQARLTVETAGRRYEFELETGEGLAAAYLVRFVPGPDSAGSEPHIPQALAGKYRLSGDKEVRPAMIVDDGAKTYIEWGHYQYIPAVFGIGPGGDEEVVDGYMRDGVFTIDRVYSRLVFRIDKERAVARRTIAPGEQ